jgi:hypothetical protein
MMVGKGKGRLGLTRQQKRAAGVEKRGAERAGVLTGMGREQVVRK